MTVEELKAEAAKLGYNIVKRKEYIKLSRCKCGHWPTLWVNTCSGWFYCCEKCDIQGGYGEHPNDAKREWNRRMER